ncbi:MAG: type VI secretion system protein VasJ [Motiliproteus sp.]|jgi:type VI secretion system protein VasJ
MDIDAILKLASVPVDDDLPGGCDVQYGDEFSALSNELVKEDGINVKPVDWSLVRELGECILREQSKDLRVAGYLSVALFHLEGFAGLAAGFKLLRDLVEADYWQDLYPQRKKRQNKARAAAFDWVIKKLERPLSEVDIQDADAVAVIETSLAFAGLDRALSDRLGDELPANWFELRNVLNRLKQDAEHLRAATQQSAEQAQPAQLQKKTQSPAKEPSIKESSSSLRPAPPPSQPTSDVAAADLLTAVVESMPQAVTSAADIERVLTANGKSVEKLCELLRQQRLTDPRPYFLLRTSKWMTLDKLPPNGVAPSIPSAERLKYLAVQEQSENYEVLIQECEKSFAAGALFNLGLHRMVAKALLAIGAPEASNQIKICVAQLLERFPGYTGQTFANEMGFVDASTQAWIDTEVSAVQPAAATLEAIGSAGEPWLEAAHAARKQAGPGRFEAGIALFSSAIKGTINERDSCFWQLEQARFCFESGYLDIALPQLTYLYEKIQLRQLQRWEPELTLVIIKLLMACHGKRQAKQPYTEDQQQKIEALRTELCLMDPLGALEACRT